MLETIKNWKTDKYVISLFIFSIGQYRLKYKNSIDTWTGTVWPADGDTIAIRTVEHSGALEKKKLGKLKQIKSVQLSLFK